ncbi:hypothetical protein Bca4012_020235 [Brassica carinata]|uniref:Uncharacterized protein n=1 Tax=Brassica carinata TaxID=52824 RepID=A0A8X8BDA0_BRACI|nr:hypothetical protein Bca52824_001353 [Brassica carinata]
MRDETTAATVTSLRRPSSGGTVAERVEDIAVISTHFGAGLHCGEKKPLGNLDKLEHKQGSQRLHNTG